MVNGNGFRRLVHLDLKGVPPTPKRLLELPELFASLGLTGILVEWEDTFPFAHFPELKAPYTYTLKTVKEFLAKCQKLDLTVIPLIQTFGHLESLLSREKYKHLREVDNDPRCLCPLHDDSVGVIRTMIDDMLKVHQEFDLKYFHLGADEVYQLGSCPKCKKFVAKNGKDQLFLKHMNPLFDQVNSAGVRPMIWHDMMREWPKEAAKQFVGRVDIMFWAYTADVKQVENFCVTENMKLYHTLGIDCWGASAYKGADGVDKNVPDNAVRGKNNEIWYELAKKYKLKGVALTAWTRYNTLVACCEPIESSWDALTLCSLVLTKGRFSHATDLKLAYKMLYGTETPEQGCKKNTDLWNAGQVSAELEKWVRHFENWQIQRTYWVCPKLWSESRANPCDIENALREGRNCLNDFDKIAAKVKKAYKGLVSDKEIDFFLASRIEPRKFVWKTMETEIKKHLKNA